MLSNIKLRTFADLSFLDRLFATWDDANLIHNPMPGVYIGGGFNFVTVFLPDEAKFFTKDYSVIDVTDDVLPERGKDWQTRDWNKSVLPYGVCDDWEQITTRYPQLLTDPDRHYVISLTPVIRAKQPAEGGWRWHKWGEYIGRHTPEHEYLYDENPSIDRVYCYHITRIRPEAAL